MLPSSSFGRRRQGSSKSSSSDDRPTFFSLFTPRTNSIEKSRSASTNITDYRSNGSDTPSSPADSGIGSQLSSACTSFASSSSSARCKTRRSSGSNSSVFSKIRRRFSGSPPDSLSQKLQDRSPGFISWPLPFSHTGGALVSASSDLGYAFITGHHHHREESLVGDSPSPSPRAACIPIFAAKHSQLPSIFESTKEHNSSSTSAVMDQTRLRPGTLLRPGSLLADQREKARRRKDAHDMYMTIVRNAERSKTTVPPYEFLELIGKGAFGRVYKCRDQRSGDLVAVKIADIDENDFSSSWEDQSLAIHDFHKEVSILQQLKDSKAKNVNVIHDAFDLHSQLWIVADYCTGGSVRTLLYPTAPNGLEEQFIIPIARELAVALKGVHDIDLIHRDVKCANVYITETGNLQLGDFGIVGLIEDGQSKRKTIIGTPHYMPIEMIQGMSNSGGTDQAYGTEVDVWSYGITIFEMATGQPPNTRVLPHDLAQALEEQAPRLDYERHSEGLRDFVTFCLQTDPKARPTMDAILSHPYIANTNVRYPTSNLVKLVERFKVWEHGGGSRNSLWSAGGLPAPICDVPEEETSMPEEDDGWNFSTSDDFDQEFGQRLSQLFASNNPDRPGDILAAAVFQASKETPAERIRREHADKAANRGEQYLGKLFAGSEPYGMHAPAFAEPTPPPSDLPLRTYTDQEEDVSCQVIDLDEANTRLSMAAPMLRLSLTGGDDTIRASSSRAYQDEDDDSQSYYGQDKDEKRDTMAWTFPSRDPVPEKRETMAWTFPSTEAPSEKRDTMAWTFPKSDPSADKRDTMAWKFPNPDPQPEKRETMAWTFDTAGPAEPFEPESSLELPSAGENGQVPAGYRPTLKHTATEPLGRFGQLLYDGPRPSAAAPSRLSTGTIDLDAAMPIDLDAALAQDPEDIPRPSTASSATGSTMTDATSGNPFDLEEDPVQNEMDRNRFSYHKQWQSEGGRVKRSSYKSMQMHARGASLSDTDSEIEHANSNVDSSFGSDLLNQSVSGQQQHQSLQPGFGDDFSRTEWPTFGGDFSNFTSTHPASQPRDLNFPSEAMHRANGSSASADLHEPVNGFSDRLVIEMPEPEMPAPEVLAEDADPRLLASEFAKQMRNLEGSLMGMMQALTAYAHLDEEESRHASPAYGEQGFDSAKETSEDEESTYDGSTVRHDRGR